MRGAECRLRADSEGQRLAPLSPLCEFAAPAAVSALAKGSATQHNASAVTVCWRLPTSLLQCQCSHGVLAVTDITATDITA